MTSNTKVALITGAARRIGAAIACQLHEAGMNIVLHYRHSRKEAETMCLDLNQKRAHSTVTFAADLEKTTDLSLLMEQAVNVWGRLDVLVNNASYFTKTPLNKTAETAWDAIINCNLKAPFFLSQLAYPYLKQTQGCIINITDIHAEKPIRDYTVYCTSKGGLITLTKALAKEFGPLVRVNAISPGMIIWPEEENILSDPIKQKIIRQAILKREGKPQDIAKSVLFFVKEADYITGQILAVDGGR